MDIDAGPVILNLSSSGTAFALGPATFFNDTETRKGLLRTAEIAAQPLRGLVKVTIYLLILLLSERLSRLPCEQLYHLIRLLWFSK